MRFVIAIVLLCSLALSASAQRCSNPNCPVHSAQLQSVDVSPYTVNRDPVAYSHALREARYLASRLFVGHPFGVAPGCRYAGTGNSIAPKPNHCYLGELPDSRIVARAVARGRDGRWYWSCHYR